MRQTHKSALFATPESVRYLQNYSRALGPVVMLSYHGRTEVDHTPAQPIPLAAAASAPHGNDTSGLIRVTLAGPI